MPAANASPAKSVPDRPEQSSDAIKTAIARETRRLLEEGSYTKRSAVRLAFVKLIQEDVLRSGDYLPSEIELTDITGLSLGTVQAALQQLSEMSLISRRRGDGTKIATEEQFSEQIWHFRIVSKTDGSPLHASDVKVRVDKVSGSDTLSSFFGHQEQYVRIVRRHSTKANIHYGGEMFLPLPFAAGLLKVNANDLSMVNLRPYLERQLGLKITHREHLVKTVEPSSDDRKLLGLTSPGMYFEIHAKTRTSEGRPVYYQRILAATVECDLHF